MPGVGSTVRFLTSGPGGTFERIGKIVAFVPKRRSLNKCLPKEIFEQLGVTISRTNFKYAQKVAVADRYAILVKAETGRCLDRLYFPLCGRIIEDSRDD